MKFASALSTIVLAAAAPPQELGSITSLTPSVTSTEERPALLRRLSQDFTQIVIMGRSSGVPYATAASVGREFVEGALQPPQITSLAEKAFGVVLNGLPLADVGSWPDPTSAKQLADDANKVYDNLHLQPSYKSYMSYVSANAHIVDMSKVRSMLSMKPDNITDPTISSWHSSELCKTKELEHSFTTNSAGSEALKTFKTLGSKLLRDVGTGGSSVNQMKELFVNFLNSIV